MPSCGRCKWAGFCPMGRRAKWWLNRWKMHFGRDGRVESIDTGQKFAIFLSLLHDLWPVGN